MCYLTFDLFSLGLYSYIALCLVWESERKTAFYNLFKFLAVFSECTAQVLYT